jgi:hypothetical protein
MMEAMGATEYMNFNRFVGDAQRVAKELGVKWKKAYEDALMRYFSEVDATADVVLDAS